MNKIKIGRAILYVVAVFTTFAGFIIDVNYTHLFNPRWTPHARYHDALTITLALCAGLTGLYFLRRRTGDAELNLFLGTLLPAFLPVSQMLSFLFPAVGGLESEFPELVPQIGGFYFNEFARVPAAHQLDRRRLFFSPRKIRGKQERINSF